MVEDSLVNQRVAQAILEKKGHHVTLAPDGQQTLELLSDQHAYDLILMDVQMPVMDGLEATRRIRELEQQNGWIPWPIIALTGNAMQQELDECLAAGMDRCITKPMNVKELLTLVGNTPQRSRG